MRTIRWLLLTLICAFVGPSLALGEEIEWVRNYDKGLKLALETNRPVMVDLWASWCGPCKIMDAEVYTDRRLIEASKKFVFIQVDIDRDPATAARLAAAVVPTMVFLDPWGNILMKRPGLAPVSALLEMMKPIPSSFASVAGHFQALGQNKQDFNALMGIGAFYKKAGFVLVARDFYGRAMKTPRVQEDRSARDEVRIALGLLALSANDAKEAEKIFEKACKDCEPKNEPAMLLGLAKSYVQRNKIKEAREVFQNVMNRFPGTQHAQVAKDNLERLK